MAAIRTLLNPAPEEDPMSDSELETISKPESPSSDHTKPTQLRKRQKICKDAAVFTHGPIRGECRYPPHEDQDEMLAAQHQQFEVFPMGEIADYPRHIPYNSEKKFFYEKTGRESLEVFQYNFKVPGDSAQYAMLWDYNIGLVRTTPLFKCTGYSKARLPTHFNHSAEADEQKTTPAKMLNRNPGLRDICHSITGGALVAQGYWMPYDAAKAIAATFCWNIRYALTPIFGTEFPAMCFSPDSDKFGEMIIDPAITRRCNEQSNMYRALESSSKSPPATSVPAPLTPDTPTYPRNVKKFRPKLQLPANSDHYSGSGSGSEGDYTTSTSTPERAQRGLWTPANTPRSVPRFPSPNFTFKDKSIRARQSRDSSSPELSPKSKPRLENMESSKCDEASMTDGVSTLTRKISTGLLSDEKAAYLLMSLKLQHCHQQEMRGKKRRAST